MKKIIIRSLLTLSLLFCIRFFYIQLSKVPFFEQVFISTSIGFIIAQIIVEVTLHKLKPTL